MESKSAEEIINELKKELAVEKQKYKAAQEEIRTLKQDFVAQVSTIFFLSSYHLPIIPSLFTSVYFNAMLIPRKKTLYACCDLLCTHLSHSISLIFVIFYWVLMLIFFVPYPSLCVDCSDRRFKRMQRGELRK